MLGVPSDIAVKEAANPEHRELREAEDLWRLIVHKLVATPYDLFSGLVDDVAESIEQVALRAGLLA